MLYSPAAGSVSIAGRKTICLSLEKQVQDYIFIKFVKSEINYDALTGSWMIRSGRSSDTSFSTVITAVSR